jgi:hypothetical protein
MERRDFLAAALGVPMTVAATSGQTQAPAGGSTTPEFYVWRQYIVRNGTQPQRLAASGTGRSASSRSSPVCRRRRSSC